MSESPPISESSRTDEVRIGPWFEEAWALLKSHFWFLIGTHAIVIVLGLGLAAIPILGWLADFILFGPVWAGCGVLTRKIVRGQPSGVADVFAGFGPQFIPLMVAGIIFQAGVVVGLILLIIPGVYLFVSWFFPFILILDKRLEAWPAMEASRRRVTQHWFKFFLLVVILVALNLAGLAFFLVGVFLTFPLTMLVAALAYRDFMEMHAG